MEVRIRQGKNQQSQAYARFHRVTCDQPFDEGGNDTGMTPPELMLAAIGCCAMHYATAYLRTHNQSIDVIELRISAEKSGKPLRLGEIGIEVDAPQLALRSREGLLKAVEACLLHRTLIDPPKVKILMAAASKRETPAAAATAPLN